MRRTPRRPLITEWGGGASNDDSYNLEAFVAAEITLGGHLAEQLAVAFADPTQRLIGQYLIDLVDDAGYLPVDLGEATASGSAPRRKQIDTVLEGVAKIRSARRVRAQSERMPGDPAARPESLRSRDAGAGRDISICWRSATSAIVRKICGVDDDDLADMIGEIRRLDPKPGLKFGASRTQTVVPDVYVRPGPDGGWLVELNSDTLPKRAGQSGLLFEAVEEHPQGWRQVLLSRIACRTRRGWCARSTSAPAPF